MAVSTFVLLKPVPDPAGIRVDHSKNVPILPDQWVMSSFDANGLEAALTIREAQGGTVTVLTVAPAAARDVVTRALAMGSDEAVHIEIDDLNQLDGLAVATLLAPIIQERQANLVLTGQQSDDFAFGSVGPALAELLGWRQVTSVIEIEIEDGTVRAIRDTESGRQEIRAHLPIVAAAMTGLAEPRMPSLRGMMAAKKKPIDVITPDGLPVGSKIEFSSPYVREKYTEGEILQDVPPDEAAKQLVRWLASKNLV